MGKYVWPCPQYSRISSKFGTRTCPFHGKEHHDGIDLAAASGTPILAAASGTVTRAGKNGGYGNYVSIDHGGGVMTFYGHCREIYVKKGQSVTGGQKIAAVGTTGSSTGNHLHFGVHVNGASKNPQNYVSPSDTAANYAGNSSSKNQENVTDGTSAGAGGPQASKEITTVVIKSVTGAAGSHKSELPSAEAFLQNGAEILIQNNQQIVQNPCVEGEIVWETSRKGSPASLKFTVVKDDTLSFHEGNPVSFRFQGEKVFYGYVFKKSRSNRRTIEVTCYDQLRYFKNKDTISYSGKTYAELLKMLAADYGLACGTVADTKYKIPQRIEDGTLFDILGNASDLTLLNTGKMYVLYDDFGQLTLKPYEDMLLPVWVDESTAEEYDYTSTIDDETYNRMKLAYDNGDSGQREVHVFNDTLNQSKWGTLQYYEKLDKALSAADLKVKADALLKYYNLKKRELTIKSVFGDIRVRAGTLVSVGMRLGDMDLSNYMGVEKAKHTFSDGIHTMDLYLAGVRGEFHA